MQFVKKVGRLQFRRNLKSIMLQKSKIGVEILVCSEFNDSLCSQLLRDIKISVSLVSVDDNLCILLAPVTDIGNDKIKLRVVIPDVSGRFQLCFSIGPSLLSSHGVLVLSLLSEVFTVVPAIDTSLSVRTLLGCYRVISSECSSVSKTIDLLSRSTIESYYEMTSEDRSLHSLIIYEEYGITLGSHLYDSSVILLRYLQQQQSQQHSLLSNSGVIVEMGGGCGLVGIWCSRNMAATQSSIDAVTVTAGRRQVWITDLKCQETIINRNIEANRIVASENFAKCTFFEFDWGNALHASSLLDNIGANKVAGESRSSKDAAEEAISLIIATDVLYDKQAADLLFASLRRIGTSGITRVLIAQKVRDSSSSNSSSSRSSSSNSSHSLSSSSLRSATTESTVGTSSDLESSSAVRATSRGNMAVDMRIQRGFSDIKIVHDEADVIVWSMLLHEEV